LAGEKCERIMAEKIRNVEVRDVEADEVWSFIGKKEKRVRPDDDQNLGDCYTFVAIERPSKLVCAGRYQDNIPELVRVRQNLFRSI